MGKAIILDDCEFVENLGNISEGDTFPMVVDLSNYAAAKKYSISFSNGSFRTPIENTSGTLDTFIIPVKQGQKYLVTFIVGALMTAVATLTNGPEISVSNLGKPLAKKAEEIEDNDMKEKDYEFTIPEGCSHIVIVSRNSNNVKYELEFALKLVRIQ